MRRSQPPRVGPVGVTKEICLKILGQLKVPEIRIVGQKIGRGGKV
jgi:hypothetical protein